ncbi:hypothetical protein LAZ67_4004123, partial [Cordylochernes scorpioides]
MVIGLKRAGWSIRQIAADTHLGASTVHRLWRRWLEQGNVAIYRNVGATRVTSARVDRRILRQAVAAPQATCTAIPQHVQDTLDHSISTRTISRRLVANGLHSCRPLRRLPLTPPNRRQRLEWCRARSTWMTEWHRVVFSDESRFCLSSDSRRVRVWRRRGERSNPAAIVERPTVRQRGIMVWGAIAYDSRSPLLRIQGTMTAQRYVDDVLRPVTLPYLQGVPNALYQQDNARPHTARISQQALQDVQMLPWPPYSPDLSPIEHVWDIIGRRLHALPQPRSEDELWQMVEREWRAIPQDAIRTLIDALPRRVAACIAVRGHRKRRQFKQTDAFTRGMVIGLKRAGWSIRQIAADTHLGASTVHRLWRRWLEQGNVAIYRNVGATRVTSARVDRRILRQAVAAPQATCTAIPQHVQDTLDHSISTRTISRRLVANGLHSCRPLRRLPLTPPNRRQRLEWCRARSTWMTEWHRVVFSDESRFCLSSDSRRVRVWRRRGERSNPAAIVERPTVRQRGIMVWGAIAYDSRSPLLRIQGTMTAQRYVDDVLRPVTLPYLQGVPNALYQQDNARPHTARISQQALQDVQMLPWPPYSPDLSPIEHVWDIIGRRLHALPQPRSEDELWQMVEREWRAIPQDAIRTLIDALPRRVAACIAVRGHRKRRQFKQTDAFTRGMVIGLKRAGWSIRQITDDTHLGASTVHRLWRRWLEQGNVAIYRNVGATRVTSARVDRRILRQAVAAPQATCTAILQHVQDTLDHSISTRTISRRLVANGLHSCRSLRRLPLTPPNRRQRLEWCRARSTWMTEWHRVVFSDESRFCLSSDSRRVRVWRRRGERSNPAAIVERPTVRQRGIMVWGAIAYDSRSTLLRIQGTMTAQRYVDDMLRPVTLLYLQGVPNALYQQDNARPHTARISQQALQDVQMLPWPPYSPELSPIEHVWDIIGRRLHALPQPRSEDKLWQMVEREWRAIPQDAIRTLIDSLPRRVAACIAVREWRNTPLKDLGFSPNQALISRRTQTLIPIHKNLLKPEVQLNVYEKKRYKWLQMPFGISAAPEEFQRRLHEVIEGLEGVEVIADDILVFGFEEVVFEEVKIGFEEVVFEEVKIGFEEVVFEEVKIGFEEVVFEEVKIGFEEVVFEEVK